eukprot:4864725-Karenia_brevis.AAC.1
MEEILIEFALASREVRNYLDPLDQAHNLSNPSLHADNLSSEINEWIALLDRLIEIGTSPQ